VHHGFVHTGEIVRNADETLNLTPWHLHPGPVAAIPRGTEYIKSRVRDASTFSRCLSAKDVSPQDIATSEPEGDRYFDTLNQLASRAAGENGAIEAFGNDALPARSTIYFLFFAGHDAAQDAKTRLGRVAREERASDILIVRGNFLTVASSETEAQTRIINECLDQSSD
jgi:hypothetical protein